jgi:hypothetical protein
MAASNSSAPPKKDRPRRIVNWTILKFLPAFPCLGPFIDRDLAFDRTQAAPGENVPVGQRHPPAGAGSKGDDKPAASA